MIKAHKNKLLEILINAGFTIDDVRFIENEDHCIIEFIDAPLKYILEYGKYSFDKYIVGQTTYAYGFEVHYSSDEVYIDNIYISFGHWLNGVVRKYFDNLNDIDMWEVLSNSSRFIHPEFIDFNDRSYFDDFEKEQIRLVIDEFKLRIPTNINLDHTEIDIINQKLDYLVSKLDSMNKFDWKSLLVQIIVSISINMTVDTSSGMAFLELFKLIFSRIPKLLN